MKDIYKYNSSAKYKTNNGQYLEIVKVKDLYKQNIYVSAKDNDYFNIAFPNIFIKYVVTSMKTTDKTFINWQKNPFKLWQTQLNFVVFCSTSACGISSEHLSKNMNPMIKSFYFFHVYYHIRRIIKRLQIPLPYELSFNESENSYSHEEFLKVCSEYNVSNDPFKYRDQYFFSSIQNKRKIPFDESSMTRWIIEKSQGFTKIGIYVISESVRVYVYLILNSQASSRSNIVGNNANNLTAQQSFLNNFEDLINRKTDIQEDITRYQKTLSYASSKVDFSVGENIYMLPSDMNLNIKRDTIGYNNKILISDDTFKLGINHKVNTNYKLKRYVYTHEDLSVPKNKLEENKNFITHEEEKVALVLVLTLGASVWYIFK